MKKRIKNKINKQNSLPPTPALSNAYGVDAAQWSPDRHFNLFPLIEQGGNASDWDLDRIWRRARSLYANFAEVRNAVDNMVLLMGALTPRPATSDEAWNKEAYNAFIKRALNPRLFEASGRLNWYSAQKWIEKRAIIDGDCLTVLTKGAYDQGGSITLYSAPQICGDDLYKDKSSAGVVYGRNNRIDKYLIRDFGADTSFPVLAARSIMYSHNPSPAEGRTPSELIAAITTAQDLYEIQALTKTQIKIASKFGLIETKDLNDKKPGVSDLPGRAKKPTQNCTETRAEGPLVIDGVKAISLSPGHDLKTLHNNNPSQEISAFMEKLVKSIAYSVGLDPAVLFDPSSLGSAAVRFILAKSKDWTDSRLVDRKIWAARVYQHIIANEIEAGRLRPCPNTDEQYDVEWVSKREWSIDNGRDAAASMNLINAGLLDGDNYAIQISGLSRKDILERKAKFLADAKEIAEKYGLPMNALIQEQAGAVQAIDWEGVDTDAHPSDPNPDPEFNE